VPLLYAEAHYKLASFLPSRYFSELPEVIVDMPWRWQQDQGPLRGLLLVKDADKYPITLAEITVLDSSDRILFVRKLERHVARRIWSMFFSVDPTFYRVGTINEFFVDITFRTDDGTCFTFRNDNYRGLDPLPFRCLISDTSLTPLSHWYSGDMHAHSFFTEDQIEFGPPLPALAIIACGIGLEFVAVSDHSYDLDDVDGNYFRNDAKLKKWYNYLRQSRQVNGHLKSMQLLSGTEVSVNNSKRRTVHLQIFNSDTFFHGSGDSGEKLFPHRNEWDLAQLLDSLPESALAIAAHIGDDPPYLHQLLIGRGHYRQSDLMHPRLLFFQLANGTAGKSLEIAKRRWIKLLLEGKRAIPIAGSDAHGAFNYSRDVVIPHLLMRNHRRHVLGSFRTVLWAEDQPQTPAQYISVLRSGCLQLSSGPLLLVESNEAPGLPIFGRVLDRKKISIGITAASTLEFGYLQRLKIFCGLHNGHEALLVDEVFCPERLQAKSSFELFLQALPWLYLRFELRTETGKMALTAPAFASIAEPR
jgi:hypothetical protein